LIPGIIPTSLSATAAVTPAAGPASLIWLTVAIPLVSAGFLLVAGKASNAWGHWVAIAASAASFVVTLIAFFQMMGLDSDDRVMESVIYRWIPAGDFSIDVAMRIDPLSMTFLLLVTFVGTLIHVYSVGYMKHDPGRRRFLRT
jgi:NADH:ubiquinone oxidoreductase subunit 5 (chain L)/Multisubunit Na+/H+ antiporter, MnhA subunit